MRLVPQQGSGHLGEEQVGGRPGPQVLCPQVGAGPMTSSQGCQPVVCSGGCCLAQLRDPGVSAHGQLRVRVGAPRATFSFIPLPSLEPEALSVTPGGPCQVYPSMAVRLGPSCNLPEPPPPYL